jgi:pentatricopeptide repeat protein
LNFLHQEPTLTPEAALEEIRALAQAGRIEVSVHATHRMRERGVELGDVRHALARAAACHWQPLRETWRVCGEDLRGEPLTVVVALAGDVVVVTVF